MGIIISTTEYAPFPLVTGIIGIISFIFTLFTLLRVFWTNLETMAEAPHEVHGYLTNLRTELLEERASIRLMRKQSRKWKRHFDQDAHRSSLLGIELDDVTLKTMGDILKVLCKRFRDLERPFLEDGEAGIGDWKDHRRRARRRDSEMDGGGSPYEGEHGSPPEKGRHRASSRHERDEQDEEDVFWAQRTQYARLDIRRRFIWLRKKSQAQSLSETLSKVQIRRIARQVGGLSTLSHEYGQCSLQMEDMIRRIDERTSRIVGVRRVE